LIITIDKSYIKSTSLLNKEKKIIINFSKKWNNDFKKLQKFFKKFNIDSVYDIDIIEPYFRDWSNLKGYADLLVRPKNKVECAIILKTCYTCNILLTISAGKTNLTGSATPSGGVVLSTSLLTTPNISIDFKKKEVSSPIGIELESMRNKVLELSKNTLYYPVDPTSRHDAFVGGTIACNASGFIPGEKGATRYWVSEIEFLLPNGDLVKIKRNQYISLKGYFSLKYNDELIQIPVPTYDRPNIKNASGLYSDNSGNIDLIDLIIGSEGILGMIVSCKLKLARHPKDYLELFISLESESKAIDFHDFLYNYFNYDMSQLTALEYFGYNSQKYMIHKEFLFSNDDDVGIYLQIPIFNESLESKVEEWIKILKEFSTNLNLDNIIVLNDPLNWKKFFEARHSIPDNALTQTRKLGGVSIITDTIVPPKNYRMYLDKVHKKLRESKIEYLLFGHLGDCHLHFHLIPSDEQDKKCLEVYDYLIDLSSELGGVYSAEHGTGKRKRNDFRKCYGLKAVEMVKKLKTSIDAYNYLNNGNLVEV